MSWNASTTECNYVHQLNTSDQCYFVNSASDCQSDSLLQYVAMYYCNFPPNLQPLAIICYVGLLFLFFVALSISAGDYFCPSLGIIVEQLRISDNIAGVTFVAFGNGAPDIFSAIAAVENSNADLMIGSLFGAGIFVTTITVAGVVFIKPFDVMKRPFVREIVFYLAAWVWTLMLLRKGTIGWEDGLGFIGLYIVYVFVVVVGRIIRKKVLKEPSSGTSRSDQGAQHTTTVATVEPSTVLPDVILPHPRAALSRVDSEEFLEAAPWHYRVATSAHASPLDSAGHINSYMLHDEVSECTAEDICETDNGGIWATFYLLWVGIRPFSATKWNEAKWFHKIWLIATAPVSLLLVLTIPLVDPEAPRNNWNKPLSMVQCVLAPLIAAFVTKGFTVQINGHFPVWGLILLIGSLLAVVVWQSSVWNEPPIYHKAFAYAGFVMAVIWIYSLADAVVDVLTVQIFLSRTTLTQSVLVSLFLIVQAFGVIFDISADVLGLTVLAWSNSIGDLIVDLSVAKQGYPRMAVSACFGGQMFNLLMGIGISFTYVGLSKGSVVLKRNAVQEILVLFMGVSLVFSMCAIILSRFRASRPYGAVLVVIYLTFLLLALLTEFGAMGAMWRW